MFVLDDLLSCITNSCFEALKDNVKEIKSRDKLYEELENFVNKKFSTEIFELDLRFDYQGFLYYLKKYAIKDMQEYLRESDLKTCDKQRNAIISKAISSSSSNGHKESEELVQKLVLAVLEIIKDFYTSHILTGEIVVFKSIVSQGTKAIIKKSDENAEKILDAIEKSRNNQENNELEKLIIARKEIVKNQALFPWFYNSLKYREVFPSLFVEPKFENRYGECSLDKLLSFKHNHIAILGDAGSGKSTLLKYLFAFNLLNNANCYYLHASELINVPNSPINKLFNQKQYNNEPLILFMDGIDEAYSDDLQGYRILIDNIKNISCCCCWIACRSDFFYQTLNENTAFTHDGFVIQPWNVTQSEYFINRYSEIVDCSDIPKRISDMVSEADDLVKFKQNPFQLALLVFLAHNSKEENVGKVKGLYSLYDSFVKIWIDGEKNRGTSKDSKKDIYRELEIAANLIYSGNKYKISDLANNNTAIKNLLIIDTHGLVEDQYASTFYHRSLAAFFLARVALVSMLENDTNKLTKIFSCKLKDDVTNFINDAFAIMPIIEKEKVNCNLQFFYDKVKYQDKFLTIKEQIIYYLTRLGVDVSDFLFKEINPRPTNLTMRLTLAYGCVLSDATTVKEFALEYAKSIADNSEDAVTNRAWTVIYFGDKIGNPYEYKDNEQCSWEKARKARIKRFTKENPRPKDFRFRLFDIPLFYSFLCDRGWNNLSIEEYKILSNIQFPIEHFNEKERDFLSQQLSSLLKEYKNKLDITCNPYPLPI